jgi:hypothetical protein
MSELLRVGYVIVSAISVLGFAIVYQLGAICDVLKERRSESLEKRK